VSPLEQFWQRVTPSQLKRILIAVVALLLIPFLVATATQDGAGGSGSGGGRHSPDSIFSARSPGARDDGLVSWVKKRLASAPRARPPNTTRERVLPGSRTRPTMTLQGPPDFAPLALLGAAGDPTTFPPDRLLGFAPPIPAFAAPGFDDVLALPPSPGGAPSGEGGNPTPPGPAVPEIATWLQMIVAIGVIGLTLRRRRERAATVSNGKPARQAALSGRGGS